MLKLLELTPKRFTDYFFKSFNNTFSLRVYLRLLALVFLFNFSSLIYQFNDLSLLDTPIKIAQNNISLFFNIFTFIDYEYAYIVLMGCAILSILLFFLITPFFSLLFIAYLYSSLIFYFPTFLSYQWDFLLIETALVSMLLLSPKLFLLNKHTTSSIYYYQTLPLILLSVRLFFHSGIVKLLSNSYFWSQLSALDYHLFSQPMPHLLSFYFHKFIVTYNLSPFFVYLIFVIELIIPFGLLAKPYRKTSALILILFQIAIMLTGNFGYFNFLVCCPLIFFILVDFNYDKISLNQFSFKSLRFYSLLIAFLFILNSTHQLVFKSSSPILFSSIFRKVFLFNQYGLFANMTTDQKGIQVYTSTNHLDWDLLDLHYYDDNGYPELNVYQPYLPRIRWQMWFLAFPAQFGSKWFHSFLSTLGRNPYDLKTLVNQSDNDFSTSSLVKICFQDIVFNLNKQNASDPFWVPISSPLCRVINSSNKR